MKLSAAKREIKGKANSALRQKGLVPAVVYGREFAATAVTVDLKEFRKIYREAGESTLIDLNVEGIAEPLKVLIKDVQRDPVSETLIHADFYKADLTEKVTVSVPLKVIGESAVIKSGQGILLTLLNEIEVAALPLNLPHEVLVDISRLTEIGQGIAVKELPIDPTKVKVLGNLPDDLVVKIDYAVQLEKEEEVKTVEEVEVLKEKKEGEEESASETEGEIKTKKEEPAAEKEDVPAGKTGKKEKK